LTSLGIVYGDIGTSPLYAVRECFFGRYGVAPTEANVLGVLSLVTWSLILIISVKYLAFVLRADHDGEGGILALMELVRRPAKGIPRKVILVVGLFGAALLYGDGMITPAISVLSAIEGLEIATPVFQPYVIPITVTVLIALFLVQRLGTAGVGRLFGPVMLAWFAVLASAGAVAIVAHPSVLAALDPRQAALFFGRHRFGSLGTMAILFLVVTGGEALYADIGHFGTGPIRIGWFVLVLPSLMLNYFGQGALILAKPGAISNPFFQLVPAWGLYPLVLLATFATVIASQAIISGAFSLTFQAFHLGYLPRLEIRHTSSEQRGQIYVPQVNWILMAATIGLVLGFRRSGNLAAAYGVAIAATMVITTALFHLAMRELFHWPRRIAWPLTTGFLIVDLSFFVANMKKFAAGGWFPLLVAGVIFLIMTTWQKGKAAEMRKRRNQIHPVREFLLEIGGGGKYRRVPGQAIYLTSNARGTPHALRHNLEHNRALHQKVILYTARFVKAPRVDEEERLKVTSLREDITRIVAYHGYMESPNVPANLDAASRQHGLGLDLDRVTYFLGGEMLQPDRRTGMSGWRSSLYALLARNEVAATRFFDLPPGQVFGIGTQIRV
jgi:KUP system potassium uptake protein